MSRAGAVEDHTGTPAGESIPKPGDEDLSKHEYNMDDMLEMYCSGKTWKPWTQEEDEMLSELVAQLGGRDWQEVAKKLSAATGIERQSKSCRQRWTDQLDPKLNHRPFSKEESELVVKYQKVYGNHWSLIASKLGNRSANMVKNHWYSMKRKFIRIKTQGSVELSRRGSASSDSHTKGVPLSERNPQCVKQRHGNRVGVEGEQSTQQVHRDKVDTTVQLSFYHKKSKDRAVSFQQCNEAHRRSPSYGKETIEHNSSLAWQMQTLAAHGLLTAMPRTAHIQTQTCTSSTLDLLGTARVPPNPKIPRS
eukprot:scaffold614_cov378-Pavlova_lutheri.AAC.9